MRYASLSRRYHTFGVLLFMMPKSFPQTASPKVKQRGVPVAGEHWQPAGLPSETRALPERRAESQVVTLIVSGIVLLAGWQILVMVLEIPAFHP